ncbi:MAG: hypothetical protein QM756_03190 [Polyangiaceae bacterium]
MIEDELSQLQKSALRDYADDPRVERVWQRLDAGLSARPARARGGLWLAPALGVALFAAGIVVGRQSAPQREAAPSLVAEAPAVGEGTREPVAAPVVAEEPHAQNAASPQRPLGTHAHGLRSLPSDSEAEAFVSEAAPAYVAPYAAPPSQPPDWQQKADAGDFVGARAALERAGGWDVAMAGSSPDQLMTLADLGRASSEREQAVRALRRLLDAFPGAPEAPLAAWTLANQLEQGGDHTGAADAYALYRRLSPAGDFAEDAAARQVDAALAQGDGERATELIEQYAKDFPNGRRLAELRDELDKLKAEAARAGGDKAPAPVVAAPAVEPSAAPQAPLEAPSAEPKE